MPKLGMRIALRTMRAMMRGRMAKWIRERRVMASLEGGGGGAGWASGCGREMDDPSETMAEPSRIWEERGWGSRGWITLLSPVRCSTVEMRGLEARAYLTTGLIYGEAI